MNYSGTIYILIALIAVAATAFLFFLFNPAAHRKRSSLLASLSFAFIVGEILFGEE